ncbi:zeta toxin family protein [Arcicella sp. DC2W]|uniref:Zeta toxin family protein n=1 Tax=Arcicella gelida TaxID=2984195 RepID=A0ABU5S1E3_9BACT|nr:zeta toxin family protein [Arcicella sp. DC2W]MEA5402284.1 zeta toxin family protein [Arcicella sp. DC2W]
MLNLFVITGANGAGKSTLSKDLLPLEFSLLEVFDGDKFFVEKLKTIFPSQIKSPKYARDSAFQATVEAFENLVENAIKNKKDFAYEGHFSTPAPWATIEQFKVAGYRITMFFLMVNNVELSQKRVSERVKTGGHYVTSKEIEKNYYGNLIQLNTHFNLLDELIIADNSQLNSPSLLFHSSNQEQLFKNIILPNWFETYLTKIYSLS